MKHLSSLASFALLLSVAAPQLSAADKSDSTIYELRQYTTAEGKLPALHKRFREHTVALFKKHGMTNVAYWVPENKPNTLIYLLKHKNVAARNKSFAAFGADPEWKKVFRESRKNGPIVIKVDSKILKPTDYSPKSFAAAKPDWIYELRTYTTNKGKLPNLNARFRDHTMALFKKHGIHNVLYTIPQKKTLKDHTLIYIIAHKDRKTADASWKAFGSDPAWRKVAKESQKDGRILVKGGVKRVYMKTTDYSPVK
jgi:L-rhamnose mutarotase